MLNFITLFDKNYMSRGIVLYNSLLENCKSGFILYVIAMDEISEGYLNSLKLSFMVIITVPEIKVYYPVLDKLQQERTKGEFCWTLSSFSIQYAIQKYNLDSCCYLDSDVCFYDDPQILINEMGNKSVLITEHNYTPEYDQSATSGKFCVQFVYFKNNEDGNRVLEYWRVNCEKWCYNRVEDGKFGDQKYLDDWENRFEGIVYNCRNIGCGVAPWNVQKFEVFMENQKPYVSDRITKVKCPVIFFHYHALMEIGEKKWCLSKYRLNQVVKDLLFRKYIIQLYEVEKKFPEGLLNKEYKSLDFSFLARVRLFFGYLKRYKNYKKSALEILNNIEYF